MSLNLFATFVNVARMSIPLGRGGGGTDNLRELTTCLVGGGIPKMFGVEQNLSSLFSSEGGKGT